MLIHDRVYGIFQTFLLTYKGLREGDGKGDRGTRSMARRDESLTYSPSARVSRRTPVQSIHPVEQCARHTRTLLSFLGAHTMSCHPLVGGHGRLLR